MITEIENFPSISYPDFANHFLFAQSPLTNDNDNEIHFFSENNVQCYKYIVGNKSTLGKKT